MGSIMHPDSTNSSDKIKVSSSMENFSLQKELNENGPDVYSVPTFLSISEELDPSGLFQECSKCKALQLELDRNKKVLSCMKQKLISSEQRLKASKENEELCDELKLMTQNLENVRCELKIKNMELESTCSHLEGKLSESLQEQLKLQQHIDSINSELEASKKENEDFHVKNEQLEMELVQYKSLTVQKMNAEEDLVVLKKNVLKKNKKISKIQDQYEKSSNLILHKEVEIKKMRTSFKALLKVLIRFGTKLNSAKLANKKDKKLLETYAEKLKQASSENCALWDDSCDENCTSSELESSPQKGISSMNSTSSSQNKNSNSDIEECNDNKGSLGESNSQATLQPVITNGKNEDSIKKEPFSVNVSNERTNGFLFQKPANTLGVSNESSESTSNFYVESSFSYENIKVNSEIKPFEKQIKSPISEPYGHAHSDFQLSNGNYSAASSASTVESLEEKNILDPTSSDCLSNVRNSNEIGAITNIPLVKSNVNSDDMHKYHENESFGLPSSNKKINVSQNFLFKRYLKQPFAECQSNSDIPVVDDGLDISIGDLNNLKQQICLNTEQLAPLSPLPPTPPPNNRSQRKNQERNPTMRKSLDMSENQMGSNGRSSIFSTSDPSSTSSHGGNKMPDERSPFAGVDQKSIHGFNSSTAPNFFPLKRHNLCHQQSEGFEVQKDPISSPVQSLESFDSRPSSASGRVPQRVTAKRCHDGSIKLDMNLQNHSLGATKFEVDVETGQVSFIFSPAEVKPSTFSPIIINNSTPQTSIKRMETNSFDCIQTNESRSMVNEQSLNTYANSQNGNLNHSACAKTNSHAWASGSDRHHSYSERKDAANCHNASSKSIQNLTSVFTREQSLSPKSVVSSSAENSFTVKSTFNRPSKLNTKFSECRKFSQNLLTENEMKKYSPPENQNCLNSQVLGKGNLVTSINCNGIATVKVDNITPNKNLTNKLASNRLAKERKFESACDSVKTPDLHDDLLPKRVKHTISPDKSQVEVSTTEKQESESSKILSSAFIDHQYHRSPNKRVLRSRKDSINAVESVAFSKSPKTKNPKRVKKINVVETDPLLQSPEDISEPVVNSNGFHNFELAEENDKNISGNSNVSAQQAFSEKDLCRNSEEKEQCPESRNKTKKRKLGKTKAKLQRPTSPINEIMNNEESEPPKSFDLEVKPCKPIDNDPLVPDQSNADKNDIVSIIVESALCLNGGTLQQDKINPPFNNSHKDLAENSASRADQLHSMYSEPSNKLLDSMNKSENIGESVDHCNSSQNAHASNSNGEFLNVESSIVNKTTYTEQGGNQSDTINENLLEHKMQVDYDSSGDDMLVIAEDSASLPGSESKNCSEQDANGIKDMPVSSSATAGSSVLRKRKPKKSKAKKSQKKKKQPTPKKEPPQPAINAALEMLEKLKFNDLHHKQYTHNLFCALVNPTNASSPDEVVLPLITHLAASKRNPMIPYMASKDPSELLPLIESCIVSCLIEIENKKKPHLTGLLKTTLNALYFSILTKKMVTVYGLASLCRVLCFLCKKIKDLRTPFHLCCTLLKVHHRFASYLIASIASVWPEMLKQQDLMTDGNSLFVKIFTYTLFKKPKELTETLWKQCTAVLNEICHIFKNAEMDLIETAFDVFMSIQEKVFGETYVEEEIEEYSTSLVILSVTEGWDWFEKLLLNNHIKPMILKLMYENNIESQHKLSLICNMFVDISFCVEPENKHPQVFWSSITSEMFTNTSELPFFVQESLICALMKLYIMKSIPLTKTLQEWLAENQKLICEKKIASVYKVHHWKDSADSNTFRVEDFNLDKMM